MVSIFSGRDDPQWQVPTGTVRRLKELWRQLEGSEGAPPLAPPLGYRGSTLDCGTQGRWFAYGGVVASDDAFRRDPERKFERLLLASAPDGLIPAEILRGLR